MVPRYPAELVDQVDFVPADKTALLHKHTRKKVSIVPPNYSLPSTSTSEFKELPSLNLENEIRKLSIPQVKNTDGVNWHDSVLLLVLQIHLPSLADSDENNSKVSREESVIELTTLDFNYEIQSLSSNESDDLTEDQTVGHNNKVSKLTRSREPAAKSERGACAVDIVPNEAARADETLSVVIERSEPSSVERNIQATKKESKKAPSDKHSGIVLSPLQLGQ